MPYSVILINHLWVVSHGAYIFGRQWRHGGPRGVKVACMSLCMVHEPDPCHQCILILLLILIHILQLRNWVEGTCMSLRIVHDMSTGHAVGPAATTRIVHSIWFSSSYHNYGFSWSDLFMMFGFFRIDIYICFWKWITLPCLDVFCVICFETETSFWSLLLLAGKM